MLVPDAILDAIADGVAGSIPSSAHLGEPEFHSLADRRRDDRRQVLRVLGDPEVLGPTCPFTSAARRGPRRERHADRRQPISPRHRTPVSTQNGRTHLIALTREIPTRPAAEKINAINRRATSWPT